MQRLAERSGRDGLPAARAAVARRRDRGLGRRRAGGRGCAARAPSTHATSDGSCRDCAPTGATRSGSPMPARCSPRSRWRPSSTCSTRTAARCRSASHVREVHTDGVGCARGGRATGRWSTPTSRSWRPGRGRRRCSPGWASTCRCDRGWSRSPTWPTRTAPRTPTGCRAGSTDPWVTGRRGTR